VTCFYNLYVLCVDTADVVCASVFYFIYYDFYFILHIETYSIFISVFNQLDAQNLFHNKFYLMPLHILSTCVHHQEVKIALYSLWYHHTETSEWSKLLKYNSINMSK